MAVRRLGLTRDQLASFLSDFEQIKQFENLFRAVDDISTTQLDAVNITAGNAEATAGEALAQLKRIADSLELLADAPVEQNNNSVATDYVDLNERAPIPADKPGRTYWNLDDGTMDVDLYGGSVLQVGQEIMFYAKNTSGGTIANGTPVMFTGTVGSSGKLTFGLAVADGSVLADYMMGVATQDIADNQFGYVTSFGLVRGFNTTGSPYGETWADGDLLYFDPATPGTWTNVQPAAPNIDVPVAVVINAGSGGSGSIFVRMSVAQALNRLQDVYINGTGTPLAGQTLLYDATQQRWENHHLTAGTGIGITNGDGSVTIALSTPVAVTSGGTGLSTAPTNGQLLIGNGAGYSLATLTAGSNVTITNGPGSIIIAAATSGGTVTSVDVSGGTTGLTFSGGPITNNGTITMAGTLGVSNGGTGTTTAFTAGSVVFAGASGVYTQDNANLFWDNSANRLGIGTAAPGFPLEVNGETRASKFTTSAGTQSLADTTNLTILTVTGVTPRVWMVCMAVDAAGGGDTTVALVIGGNNGLGGPSLVVTQLANGTTTDVSVSGGDIIVQQTTGVTQTVSWSITRIM